MSLDIFCLVILLFFLFGLAVSASEGEYGYPRKLPEPNNLLQPEELEAALRYDIAAKMERLRRAVNARIGEEE